MISQWTKTTPAQMPACLPTQNQRPNVAPAKSATATVRSTEKPAMPSREWGKPKTSA